MDSPHKGQVTRQMFPFDGAIMNGSLCQGHTEKKYKKFDRTTESFVCEIINNQ